MHGKGGRRVKENVRLCAFITAVVVSGRLMAADAVDVGMLLKAVEARYNRPKTMQMAFEQSLTGGARMSRKETGELFLAKPGKSH